MIKDELVIRRKRIGMTQAQLASYLGVARNTVARWERGEMKIGNSQMVQWMLKDLEAMNVYELQTLIADLKDDAANHPTIGPAYRDSTGAQSRWVKCPDCGQMEWWTDRETSDHGMCRASAPEAVCPVCGETLA